ALEVGAKRLPTGQLVFEGGHVRLLEFDDRRFGKGANAAPRVISAASFEVDWLSRYVNLLSGGGSRGLPPMTSPLALRLHENCGPQHLISVLVAQTDLASTDS